MKKMLENILGKSIAGSSREEIYIALLNIVKQKMDDKVCEKGKKKLYYISAEFLIGKLLSNNLINLKLYDEVKEVLKELGIHELNAEIKAHYRQKYALDNVIHLFAKE